MNLKNARIRAGLTQEEVAEKLKIDQSAISLWETGRNGPKVSRLPEIAKLFGTTIDELLKEDEEDGSHVSSLCNPM